MNSSWADITHSLRQNNTSRAPDSRSPFHYTLCVYVMVSLKYIHNDDDDFLIQQMRNNFWLET